MLYSATAWTDDPIRPWNISSIPPLQGDQAFKNFEDSYQVHRSATQEDLEFALYAGKSYVKPLLDCLDGLDKSIHPSDLADMMLMDEWADRLLLEEKRRWKVARPFELATSYKIMSDVPHTQLYAFGYSYPSGHALLARLWSRALSALFPDVSSTLLGISELIALSRVHTFVHTFADVQYGITLADEAWTHRFT